MKLVVGLGNPGSQYERTRHNVGFMVVDRLARRHGLVGNRKRFNAMVADGTICGQKVMLMQPATFMNRSGQAVGQAVRYHQLAEQDLMLVVDDTALPTGTLRLRKQGSPGGHNGLADVARTLDTDAYPRLRVGIGLPRIGDQPISQVDYVLGRFSPEQLQSIEPALESACDTIETWLQRGIEIAMNQCNSRPAEDQTDDNDKPRTS